MKDVNVKKENQKTVEIPESLFDRIDAEIKGTNFGAVTDYVVHVLRERLAEGDKQPHGYTKEEEDRVKERLRALGYL